jgi:GntR family transcriptional regulator, transcriptional repressor for pyruvate dehydrogenase complex
VYSVIDSKDKVFIGILKKIQRIITDDALQEGDKLPSERELSERLNAGRSSVREALRSLELLGLIETKRGEGTYIKNPQHNHLTEILASFILNSYTTRRDLYETKMLIKINAFHLACDRANQDALSILHGLLISFESCKLIEEQKEIETQFNKVLVESCQNHLLLRLWKELVEYASTLQPANLVSYDYLSNLYEYLKNGERALGERLIRNYYDSFIT